MKSKTDKSSEPVLLFAAQDDWSTWLEENHCNSTGLWLRIAKKGGGLQSVTYAEALEAALCYGWIDGQKRPESDEAWLQRFLPRSPRSIWSKINRDKVLALIASNKMRPAGVQAVDAAKACGAWDAAYDSPKSSTAPPDLQVALDANPKALKFFQALDSANRYAILFRVQNAKKAETRTRKILEFIDMLERGEKIHQHRRSPKKPPQKAKR